MLIIIIIYHDGLPLLSDNRIDDRPAGLVIADEYFHIKLQRLLKLKQANQETDDQAVELLEFATQALVADELSTPDFMDILQQIVTDFDIEWSRSTHQQVVFAVLRVMATPEFGEYLTINYDYFGAIFGFFRPVNDANAMSGTTEGATIILVNCSPLGSNSPDNVIQRIEE